MLSKLGINIHLTKFQVHKANIRRNITSWLFIPLGITIILLICLGVDSLIGLSSVSFPASVAVMILLFVGLILMEFMLGERKTKAMLAVIEVPVSSSMRIRRRSFRTRRDRISDSIDRQGLLYGGSTSSSYQVLSCCP